MMRNTLSPLASNDLLCGAHAGVLREAQDQPVAVFDYELTLLVNASLGAVKNVGATRAQFSGQGIDSDDLKTCVIRTLSSACANIGLFGATEEHSNTVALYDSKNRRGIWIKTNLLSIPIAGYLETEDVPVILRCTHDIWDCELRNGGIEANRHCVGLAHLVTPRSAT